MDKNQTMESLLKQLQASLGLSDFKFKDWMTTPSPAFGNKTPNQIVKANRKDVIYQMILRHRLGSK